MAESPDTQAPGRYRYKKDYRLRKRRDFVFLSRGGKKIQNQHLIVLYAPAPATRLGVTVSKRVGPAVKRNRIKRLMREYYRVRRAGISGGWDINLIAKKEAAACSANDIFKSIENIFSRLS